LFGIPAYFAIELFYEPRYLNMRRNLMTRLRSLLHQLPAPLPAYRRMIKLVGPFSSKAVVVDYNSPVGIVGKMIQKKFEFKKLIIANSAEVEVKYLAKYLRQKKFNRVVVQKIRIGQIKTRKITHFISYNNLGYVKDVEKFVKGVSERLVKGGKFCFYVNQHWFNLSPNALLLEDKNKVLELFRKNKLQANCKYKKLLIKKGIYVYGKK